MARSSINPEKITRPFQLMAAWFTMLVLIVSAFLAAALKIQKPEWAAGFLVIASFVIVVMVLAVVFVMLTKYRPHLQDGREYSEWLKDERRYSADDTVELMSAEDDPPAQKCKISDYEGVRRKSTSRGAKIYQADVIDVGGEDSFRLVSQLGKLGFNANVYAARYNAGNEPQVLEMHEAIWVGANIPPKMVCEAIKVSVGIWPHLKYMHLSSDSAGPAFTHDQLFVGGATSAANRIGLKAWTNAELKSISNDISFGEFHRLIKSKYVRQ